MSEIQTKQSFTQVWGTYFKLVLTMIFWGGTWPIAHVLVEEVSPLTGAFVRFIMASIMLGWMVKRSEGYIPKLGRSDAINVLGMGVFGIFLYSYCFLAGLKHIEAGRGALVIALNPVVIALIAWAWFREQFSFRKWLGITLALIGCLFVVSKGHPSRLLAGEVGVGELLILGCVLSWALYTFIGRRATRTLSPLVTTFYASAIGAVLLGLAALTEQPWVFIPKFSGKAWLCLLYLSLFGTALSYTWFTGAVKKLGAAKAAPWINLVPLSGVLFGALFLHERLSIEELMGGALTLIGVMLTVYQKTEKSFK